MHKFTQFYIWMQAKKAEERGAGLAEYALLLFLIAVAVFGTLTALGARIDAVYQEVIDALS